MRNKNKIASDNAQIATLVLQKHTHDQIATQLGLTRQTVTHTIGKLRKLWQSQAILNTNELLTEELASLDAIIRELWLLYDASKKDKIITTKKASSSPNGKKEGAKESAEVVEKVEKNIGDKAILDSIVNALDKRAKLLGLHTTHLKVSGNLNVQQTFKEMSDEELDAFIKNNEKS